MNRADTAVFIETMMRSAKPGNRVVFVGPSHVKVGRAIADVHAWLLQNGISHYWIDGYTIVNGATIEFTTTSPANRPPKPTYTFFDDGRD